MKHFSQVVNAVMLISVIKLNSCIIMQSDGVETSVDWTLLMV